MVRSTMGLTLQVWGRYTIGLITVLEVDHRPVIQAGILVAGFACTESCPWLM